MAIVEMFVGLKVPDNIAITAFNTLKRMGYNKLKNLERSDYYKFDVEDNIEKFKQEISNTDIIVNSNKNKFSFTLENNNNINNKKQKNDYAQKSKIPGTNEIGKKINVLVEDIDGVDGLLSTLKERLGFENIKKLEKGILWTMYFDKHIKAKDLATSITKDLLANENYQKYEIIE